MLSKLEMDVVWSNTKYDDATSEFVFMDTPKDLDFLLDDEMQDQILYEILSITDVLKVGILLTIFPHD